MKKVLLFPVWLSAFALQLVMVSVFIAIAIACQPVQAFLKWYEREA